MQTKNSTGAARFSFGSKLAFGSGAELDESVLGKYRVKGQGGMEDVDVLIVGAGASAPRLCPVSEKVFMTSWLPLLLQSFYEGHPVQAVHGRQPGAPFPEGYDLEQSDWSSLDQVKTRSAIYRQATS